MVGSLVDCASISALAALAHFKRPDVTTDGEEIKVHSTAERDPIPLTLHHYPICVSFALLNNRCFIFCFSFFYFYKFIKFFKFKFFVSF